MSVWNPWHGCQKISPGCQNCYVYRRDSQFGKDSRIVTKTKDFSLPVQKNRTGAYKLKGWEPVYTCMTSDFFIEEADAWRLEAWQMIKERKDLHFIIITKRISRFMVSLPEDWGAGYQHVTIVCTCEDQKQADKRLPIFLEMPIIHREIIHEPMLEEIHIEPYLATGKIEKVTCGGESGQNARLCHFDWVLSTRKQCIDQKVAFCFRQTGANFKKGNKVYQIDRKYQLEQAKKAEMDYTPNKESSKPADMKELFERLSQSTFRSRFRLGEKELFYLKNKGMNTIKRHAEDFIRKRLAPQNPVNDGKQTPMRGHPVFIAQHATATCCRGCLLKWHGIPKDKDLSENEQAYIVAVIMEWIRRQLERSDAANLSE